MTAFSRRALMGAASLAAAGVASTKIPAAPARRPDRLGTAIDAAVRTAMDGGACPGTTVSIWRKGAMVFSKSYGAANLETGTAVSETSVFRIGSLTKQFTAAAIVKLAVAGKLTLDDPIAGHLEFFSKLPALTVRELLTHTAGLHSDETAPVCLSEDGNAPSQVDLARAIATQSNPFDFPPGTAWLYSNANYIVLGAVIETVSSRPLAEAMQALVFAPLGLTDTAFDDTADIVRGRVSGYTPAVEAGRFVHAAYIPVAEAGGAGAMRSTARDLCAWHHRLLSANLFDAAHVKAMMTPGRLRDGRPGGAHRFSPADAAYGDTQYGFGLLLPPRTKGHSSILHYGAINGFASCLETYTDLELTVAVLCNADMKSVAADPGSAARRDRPASLIWIGGKRSRLCDSVLSPDGEAR